MKKWLLMALFSLALMGCAPPDDGSDGDGADNGGDANVTATEMGGLADENTTLVKVSVPGMSCPEGCPPMVEGTLAKCPGVEKVVVDFDSKTATMAVNAEQFDSTQAVAALADVGFESSQIQN